MADEYAQRFVNALVEKAAKDPNDVEIIGEISAEMSNPPHVGVYLQLGQAAFLATTAGVSAAPLPPVDRGLRTFELCALTANHSASLLKLLSDLAVYMVGALAKGTKPFLPYETIQVAEDERLLLVPRWSFVIPDGPAVDVVEPLPLADSDWNHLGPLSLDERAKWVHALGASAPDRWKAMFPKL